MKSGILFGFLSLLIASSSYATVKTSEELRDKYPNVSEHSERPENKKILCPFHRMIERSGLYDKAKKKGQDILVTFANLISATREFGCEKVGCGAIASITSLAQVRHTSDVLNGLALFGVVNITKLHRAKGFAHECGITFTKDGSEVSDEVRTSSLARLKELSELNDFSGTLKLADLMKVKLEVCESRGVKITKPGEVEMMLIFEYLGGKERGHIEYDDVHRFLHAEMPLVKASKLLGLKSLKSE